MPFFWHTIKLPPRVFTCKIIGSNQKKSNTLLESEKHFVCVIFQVHGLLHLLGFDDKISNEAKMEMEREEELVLGSLGWRRKAPIRSSTHVAIDEDPGENSSNGNFLGGFILHETFSPFHCLFIPLKPFFL